MAKIVVEMDTEAKTLVAKVDGTVVDNVKEVSMCADDEYEYCSVNLTMYEMVGDMRKITRLVAKESEEAKKARADGNLLESKYVGLDAIRGLSQLDEDILEYWSR